MKLMYRDLCVSIHEQQDVRQENFKNSVQNCIKRINLTKEVKDLYLENYKTLMKEIGDNTNSQKDNTMFMDWKNQHC